MAHFEQEDSALSSATFFYNNSTDQHYPVVAHWHYHIEALYILQGNVQLFLNDHYFTLYEGDFIQFNPKDIHAIYCCDENAFSYCVCRLPVSLFYSEPQHAFSAKYVLPYLTKVSPQIQVLRTADSACIRIKELINILIYEAHHTSFLQRTSIGVHISLIYLHMLRHWKALGTNYDVTSVFSKIGQSESSYLLQPCFLYLATNFRHLVKANEIADSCNLSYSYFTKLFKSLTGRTVTQYINYLRIEEAERLLLSSHDNITSIAMQIGFPDASKFIRSFKTEKGITPKQYQKLFNNL